MPDAGKQRLGSATKDRTLFQRALTDCVRKAGVDLSAHVLIVGGSYHDVEILHSIGFRRMTISNIQQIDPADLPHFEGVELDAVAIDAEEMHLADSSYDMVLTHEVLHHCRSPHRALLEMIRVSRRHVIFMEPNDSLLMRAFIRLQFSFPYEVPSVVAHGCQRGGVRDSCVPNFIYRWSPHDLYKTTATYIPEYEFDLYIRRYWDFNVDKSELKRRNKTRIGSFTRVLGPDLFLHALRTFQSVANRTPWFGRQGNKFLGCVTKHPQLKPWLVREGDRIMFNRAHANYV